MYSGTGNTTSLVLGFPIRTSSDQRSVDSSPRLIAASYVLHRLSMPRHPPCALKHLQHKKPKMSKIAHQKRTPPKWSPLKDARNHYPQIKHHTPPPRWSGNKLTHRSAVPSGRALLPVSPKGRKTSGPVASKPNSVSGSDPPKRTQKVCCAPDPHPLQV
jgi:hypothetical protein